MRVLRGRTIEVRFRLFRRGQYVKASDLVKISELCEFVRCCQQRMKWPDAPFVDNVEAMLSKRAPRPKGKERRG